MCEENDDTDVHSFDRNDDDDADGDAACANETNSKRKYYIFIFFLALYFETITRFFEIRNLFTAQFYFIFCEQPVSLVIQKRSKR